MPARTWEEAVCALRDSPGSQDTVRHSYLDDPVEEAAKRFYLSEEWRHTRTLLAPRLPGRAVELGAGRGIASYALARENCNVVAVEPDGSDLVGRGAIARLQRLVPGKIDICAEFAEDLSLPGQTFDIAYARAVLHHARNLDRLCQQVARVLKPGGLFLAVREHVVSDEEQLRSFLDAHPLHKYYGGENAYSHRRYRHAIANAGFRIVRTFRHWDTPINYYPGSRHALFERRLGRRIAGAIYERRLLECAIGRVASLLYSAPGRHSAFLAQRMPDS